MSYEKPYIGKQTVQPHPDPLNRVPDRVQVSTYGPNGWLIDMCPAREAKAVKQKHNSLLATINQSEDAR